MIHVRVEGEQQIVNFLTLAPQGSRGREVIAKIDIPAHLKEKLNSPLLRPRSSIPKLYFFFMFTV